MVAGFFLRPRPWVTLSEAQVLDWLRRSVGTDRYEQQQLFLRALIASDRWFKKVTNRGAFINSTEKLDAAIRDSVIFDAKADVDNEIGDRITAMQVDLKELVDQICIVERALAWSATSWASSCATSGASRATWWRVSRSHQRRRRPSKSGGKWSRLK
jgi:hypothetical protein